MSEFTPSYSELVTETAAKIVDATADLAHRSIRTTRSLWNIITNPYDAYDLANVVASNFDRAADVATVLARESQQQLDATQGYSEMLAAQAVKVQDAYLNALRGIVDLGVSNVSFVKTATEGVHDLSKRFETYTAPARAAASSN